MDKEANSRYRWTDIEKERLRDRCKQKDRESRQRYIQKD